MAKFIFKAAFAASAFILASQAMAQIVLYEREGFRGQSVVVNGEMRNVERRAGNSAASAVVEHGRWEVCEQPRFGGRCAVLSRGNYPDLHGTGLQWRIASIRPAAATTVVMTWRRRPSAGDDYAYRRRAGRACPGSPDPRRACHHGCGQPALLGGAAGRPGPEVRTATSVAPCSVRL